MIADDHIKRLVPDSDGLYFAGLRSAGIDLLQALSNKNWTDYNLHDPGVSLLEVLCYGLTDLVYRSDFDVPDYLATDENFIDYARQALFAPDQIFPSRPVTHIDYCKLIYDRLPEVDDVWIRPVNGKLSGLDELSDKRLLNSAPQSGLFSVFIRPHASLLAEHENSSQELKKQVAKLLASQRNLAEDLYQIHIVDIQTYHLAGDIEIDESRPLADVYADIYFRCAKLISSSARIERFEEVLSAGMCWEDLLTGPLTSHGHIDAMHFCENNFVVDVVKLIALIRHIPGVTQVRNLRLINAAGESLSNLNFGRQDNTFPALQFPQKVAMMQALRLVYRRNMYERNSAHTLTSTAPVLPQDLVLWEQVGLSLKKLEFEYHAFRANHGNLQRLLTLPTGQQRQFQNYSSISEHTPAIYGINHYGVPKSEPREVHARARQLKAFLYPFEQLMANYLQSLSGIRDLYSIDAQVRQSYSSQFLDTPEIPNIDVLYTEASSAPQVAQILQAHDPFDDRRNRVLDTLLAIYGESFPADSFRRFNLYAIDDCEDKIINAKIKLLSALCYLSCNRNAAFDISADYWNGINATPLQQKIEILTGCDETKAGTSLIEHLNSGSSVFVSDKRYQESLDKQTQIPQAIQYGATIALPYRPTPQPLPATEHLRVPHNRICPEMLKSGMTLSNYRLIPAQEESLWLCLACNDNAKIWPLIRMPLEEVIHYAHQMQTHFLHLNQCSEGFHILEHVLLRPRHAQTERKINDDFYAHRISIIFPGYTPRFASEGCRAWIEELVSQNLPAHILPEFYWLDFAFLAQFEQRYKLWLERLKDFDIDVDPDTAIELDAAADQLVEFLKTNRPRHQTRFWL